MKNVLYNISSELNEYIKDTGFILVVLDSMTQPEITKKSKHKIKELKNVEEHIFHPGGNHYCSMMTNMPSSYATYPIPLPQTSDRTKNRLAVFAVKLSLSRPTCQTRMTGLHRTIPTRSTPSPIRSQQMTLSQVPAEYDEIGGCVAS